jgi:nucleoid DNA-binding protein
MNKSDLINAIMNDPEKPYRVRASEVEAILNLTLAHVSKSLAKGQDVTLRNFGKLHVKQRQERTGRNPQTGGPITIPACKVVRFNAAKELQDKVNA